TGHCRCRDRNWHCAVKSDAAGDVGRKCRKLFGTVIDVAVEIERQVRNRTEQREQILRTPDTAIKRADIDEIVRISRSRGPGPGTDRHQGRDDSCLAPADWERLVIGGAARLYGQGQRIGLLDDLPLDTPVARRIKRQVVERDLLEKAERIARV